MPFRADASASAKIKTHLGEFQRQVNFSTFIKESTCHTFAPIAIILQTNHSESLKR